MQDKIHYKANNQHQILYKKRNFGKKYVNESTPKRYSMHRTSRCEQRDKLNDTKWGKKYSLYDIKELAWRSRRITSRTVVFRIALACMYHHPRLQFTEQCWCRMRTMLHCYNLVEELLPLHLQHKERNWRARISTILVYENITCRSTVSGVYPVIRKWQRGVGIRDATNPTKSLFM
jgi:hypothetical protein